MRKGFIFNLDLCVNCKACSAACILENKWTVLARNIYTFNSEMLPDLPVTNLSLACNHCYEPLCMNGCPTGAYTRDEATSAVIIKNEKCIGCNYCIWNCPYDAPKLNLRKGFIEKCNFCYQRIIEGNEPACTSACPTGALKFGAIPDSSSEISLKWVPEKNTNPALIIKTSKNKAPLRIYPAQIPDNLIKKANSSEKKPGKEWSLILFTFLVIISVSFNISGMLSGRRYGTTLSLSVLFLAAIFSIFHLRNKLNAWRAIINVRKSPLSREIVLFVIYASVTSVAVFTGGTELLFISVISGFLLLISIDSVYTYADRSVQNLLHSGQAFLTGLLIGSYLAGAFIPFIFVAVLKIIFNSYSLMKGKPAGLYYTLRIFRITFLLIIMASVISGFKGIETVKFIILLSGEFADRILYYVEFEPVNINSEITKHLSTS